MSAHTCRGLAFAVIRAMLPLVLAGCETGKGVQAADAVVVHAGSAASALAVAPSAVRLVEAPGFNVEDLTARLRVAIVDASGAPCVDEFNVRAELGTCTVAPCVDVVARQYTNAEFIVASSVSRVGDVLLASVRVQRGVDEVARANAQGKDARIAIEVAGREAGAKFRSFLIEQGYGAPPGEPSAPQGSES